MSVTLRPLLNGNTPDPRVVDSPCLCAQMSDRFCDAMDAGANLRADAELCAALAAEALPECFYCLGTGVDPNGYDVSTPEANYANGTWRVLRAYMGLDLYGECTLADFSGALKRAAQSLDNAPVFGVESEMTVEGRYHRTEMTTDGLVRRVVDLSTMLTSWEAMGASGVTWG